MTEPNLQRNADTRQVEMLPGITRRTLNHGDRTSIHEIRIAKDAVVPQHTHPHEQTGYLVSGRILFEMPGTTRELGPGDSWLVPATSTTRLTALEESIAIDIFSPVREDYLD